MLRDISSNCLYDDGASEKNNKDRGDENIVPFDGIY